MISSPAVNRQVERSLRHSALILDGGITVCLTILRYIWRGNYLTAHDKLSIKYAC
jgi:hypothetical protein